MKKRIIAAVLLLSLSLSACSTTGTGDTAIKETPPTTSSESEASATPTTSAADQVAKINLTSEPPSLNSTMTYDVVSFNVLRHVEEGLTKLDDKNQVIPGIAESWDVSDDQLTYTFHLRDAKWSNGDPVTAKDFVFAWQTVLAKDTGAPFAYLMNDIIGAKELNAGTGSTDALGVKAQDDKTLVVTLERAIPYFPFLCSQITFLPINETFYKSVVDNGGTYASDMDKMLYNGPFTMTAWNHESNIILIKNADYYDVSNVKLNEIDAAMVSDDATAYNMFATGQLDTVNLGNGDLIQQAKNAGYEVQTKSNGATEYLEFNTKDSVLSNANIRKALSYAIDRSALTNNVLKDSSTPALSFTNPDISASDGSSFKAQVGDIVKDNNATEAKAAWDQGLKELGLKETPKLTFTIDDRDNVKLKAAALQEFWKKNLGIEVEIKSMPYKSKLAAVNSGDFQINLSGWGPDYNDPMTFLDMFVTDSGMTQCGYSSTQYDTLIEQARAELDQTKRNELLVQAEQLLLNDCPISPLDFSNQAYVSSPKLKNLFRSSFQDMDFINAYME